MILLDTNVLSEMTKPAPSPVVVAWMNAQPLSTLYLTAITVAEMGSGIRALPEGRRRAELQAALERTRALFSGRILAFDEDAAVAYAGLAAKARAAGKGLPTPDGYIAAIAAAHGFIVATRDIAPFLAVEISHINPWEQPA